MARPDATAARPGERPAFYTRRRSGILRLPGRIRLTSWKDDPPERLCALVLRRVEMHRTGRSPLFHQLRRTFRAAQLNNLGLKPPPRPAQKYRPTRRRFLAATAGGLLGALYAGSARARTNGPRIAVVGAGIAGLHATYLLQRAGFDVTLYEG